MNSFYRNYNLDINFNELRAEELRNRLNQLKYLEKRYGSLENALNRKDELESKVGLVENYDYEIQKKKELLVKIKQDAFKLAEKLNLSRRSITSKLCENIVSSLNEMGMENTNFEISFSKTKGEHSHLKDDNGNYLTSNGIDLIEFLISTNKGESLKPLTEIASGGEISRVMLAVKSVLAEFDNIPTLIFDEIDTGISGRISQKVGFIMKKISSNRQLITITHLPQIAALGDNNILIKKIDNGDKTLIKANILNDVEKVLEIAKLLSGENLTEASISSAKELIKN
jgi:DNA repair protein RecN (Recombination protein N)